MDMPPLFSHNGVVGQTTSHLVASDHLSLNSLLSQSQSVYGHKGVLQNQAPGGPSHISTTLVSAAQNGGTGNHIQCTRSKKQKTIVNAIQSSLSSSIRERKRVREESSDSEDDEIENDTKNLSNKKSLSAPNVVSPNVKSPKGKKARTVNEEKSKGDKSETSKIPTQALVKKTVAFADSSTSKDINLPSTEIMEQDEGSKPPKIILPRISDLVNISTDNLKNSSEDESQKPLLSNPDAINQDREQNKRRVKAMIADVFEEPESDEEKETNIENKQQAITATETSQINANTASKVVDFKLGDLGNPPIPPSIEQTTKPSTEPTPPENNEAIPPPEKSKKDEGISKIPIQFGKEKFTSAATKLPDVPSTLEIISPKAVAPSTSATIQSTTTDSKLATTTESQKPIPAAAISGFSFNLPSSKPLELPKVPTVPLTSTVSFEPTKSISFSSTSAPKASDGSIATSSVLSSQSVLTALSTPIVSASTIDTSSTKFTPAASVPTEGFTFGAKNPPDVTTIKQSTTPFVFGKPAENKKDAAAVVPSNPVFSFGSSVSATSTAVPNTTGNEIKTHITYLKVIYRLFRQKTMKWFVTHKCKNICPRIWKVFRRPIYLFQVQMR